MPETSSATNGYLRRIIFNIVSTDAPSMGVPGIAGTFKSEASEAAYRRADQQRANRAGPAAYMQRHQYLLLSSWPL